MSAGSRSGLVGADCGLINRSGMKLMVKAHQEAGRGDTGASERCMWLGVDDLLRAGIQRPGFHTAGAFEAQNLAALGAVSVVRYDADLVDAGKEWLRLCYETIAPRTQHRCAVDHRVWLSLGRDGRWRFVERRELVDRICLAHPDES